MSQTPTEHERKTKGTSCSRVSTPLPLHTTTKRMSHSRCKQVYSQKLFQVSNHAPVGCKELQLHALFFILMWWCIRVNATSKSRGGSSSREYSIISACIAYGNICWFFINKKTLCFQEEVLLQSTLESCCPHPNLMGLFPSARPYISLMIHILYGQTDVHQRRRCCWLMCNMGYMSEENGY